ncbi:MAG TPA: hypothetical protein VJV23_09905 [Candidatus Polarisedimenticolia bacterium]|nr:hypothetical protein [Candidatus Polarisedimenticolia bacterium]
MMGPLIAVWTGVALLVGLSAHSRDVSTSDDRRDDGVRALLLGETPAGTSLQGEFIEFPKDRNDRSFEYGYLEWANRFPGFRRTALSEPEAVGLVQELRRGDLRLLPRSPLETGSLGDDDKAFLLRYESIKHQARAESASGALLLTLDGTRQVLITIQRSRHGVLLNALVPPRAGEPAREIRGLAERALPLLEDLQGRVTVSETVRVRPTGEPAAPGSPIEGKMARFYGALRRFVETNQTLKDRLGPLKELYPVEPTAMPEGRRRAANLFVRVEGASGWGVARIGVVEGHCTYEVVHRGRMETLPDVEGCQEPLPSR